MTRLSDGLGPPAPRSWVEQLMPQIPGASQDFVEQQLLWVIRDWCREGLTWVERIPDLSLSPAAGTGRFVLPSPYANTAIGFVLALQDDKGCDYYPWEKFGISRTRSWNNGQGTGERYFTSPFPGCIQVPPGVTTLFVSCIASIVPFTIHIPDWMRQQHQNAIETGVIGRLLMMPNRPWSSQPTGMTMWKQYLNWRNVERVRAQQNYVPATQHWQFPRFGA